VVFLFYFNMGKVIMADKKLKKPKPESKSDEQLDEDKMPVISMEDCEEFDPSGKKLADILSHDEDDDFDNEEIDDDIE